MDKKMYKYIGILVVMLILVVIVVWIGNLLSGGAKLTYNGVEKKLVSAAKKYTKDYPGVLPEYQNTSATISSGTLINEGYIDDLSSYLKDNVTCTGSVEVYYANDGEYNYVPELKCGDKYSTQRLALKVIEDNEYGTVNGSGLYLRLNGDFVTDENKLLNFTVDDEFEYIFRGDGVNNYVKIDENVYRIVSISSNDEILLIYTGHIQKALPWDDRYNEEFNKYQGINDYENSGIKSRALEAVEAFYNGDVVLYNKEPYSPKTKYLTVPMNLCVGKRKENETGMDGEIECSKILEEQNIGLLPAYYYMSASLDDKCTTISSKNCGNYNYLTEFEDIWWLLTANEEISNEAYMVSRTYANSSLCSFKGNIRPIIMLNSNSIYESGTGTVNDPYVIQDIR